MFLKTQSHHKKNVVISIIIDLHYATHFSTQYFRIYIFHIFLRSTIEVIHPKKGLISLEYR